MKVTPEIVLAIESAIGGGSVSLLHNGVETGNWIGDASTVSKAENLLVNIDELLSTNHIEPLEIDLVAVSAGPGSFTGIRIGIATALGLKAGLGISMASESALKAMVYECDEQIRDLTAALPVGRNSICIQRYENKTAIDEPRTVTEDAFVSLVDENREASFLVHTELFDKVQSSGVINVGANIARSIGLICSVRSDVVTEPLFIAKSF